MSKLITPYPVFAPVEDLVLGILRDFLGDSGVHVTTEFEESMPLPCVVIRNDRKSGEMSYRSADHRFLRPALISVDAIAGGPDADQEAAQLQEAVLHAFTIAQQEQRVYPGVGHIARFVSAGNAARANDWATSTGVVQYASLPRGAVRYDSTIKLFLRPDSSQERVDNPFIAQVNRR